VGSNARDGEEIQCEELDRSLSLSVNEEVGVYDAVEDVGIMDGCVVLSVPYIDHCEIWAYQRPICFDGSWSGS
jgi:hypothetical protein